MEKFLKFEEIIKWQKENYERYCVLKNAVSPKSNALSKGLVVYFGAGSSLYSKSWGEPFKKVLKDFTLKIKLAIDECDIAYRTAYARKEYVEAADIKKNLKQLEILRQKLNEINVEIEEEEKSKEEEKKSGNALRNYIKNEIEKGRSGDDVIEEIINTGENKEKKRQKQPSYPKIGDKLDKIIKEFSEMSIRAGRGRTYYDSFDEACCQIMDNDGNMIKNYDFTKYVTAHLFYVFYMFKYLSVGLITTNIDKCFMDIYEKLNLDKSHLNIFCPNNIDKNYKFNNSTIIHLHGCINNSDSLVMTYKDYHRIYPKISKVFGNLTNTQMLLCDVAQNYDVLFLGASLSTDTPIVLLSNIESNFDDRRKKKLKYIPFIKTKNISGDFIKAHTLPITFHDYPDYSVILHMLLRETAPNLFNCCLWNQNIKELYENDQNLIEDLSDDQHQEIKAFLESTDYFVYIDSTKNQIISENKYKSILKHLCENFLVSDEEEKNWSICCILDDNFSLNNGKISPLNNMPLGDTIYIIGDPSSLPSKKLSRSGAENIATEIATWRNSAYSNLGKPMGDNLKIRVIIFPCESYEEADKSRVENILKMFAEDLEKLKTRFDNGEISYKDYINSIKERLKDFSSLFKDLTQQFYDITQNYISSRRMSRKKTLEKPFEEDQKIS